MKLIDDDLSSAVAARENRWENPYKSKLELYPDKILTIESDAQCQFVHQELINAQRPLLIEVGSGSGNHLIETARRCPKHLLVGIELRYKRAVRTVEKAADVGVNNLVVLRGRVEDIAPHLKTGIQIEGCFVNFPDPWPKRRDEVNRLLTNGLMDSVACWLKVDGFLSVKTDQGGYFKQFCAEVERLGVFTIERMSEDLHASPFASDNVRSEFEELFATKGQQVYYALLRRRAI